jgi:hypothetical protein
VRPRGPPPRPPSRTALDRVLIATSQRLLHLLQVETQPPSRPAKTHPSKFAGMRIHPVPINPEPLRYSRRVGKANRPRLGAIIGQELCDARGDQLNIARMKPRPSGAKLWSG